MIKKLFDRFVGREKPIFCNVSEVVCHITEVKKEEIQATLAEENKKREILKLKKAAMLGKEDKFNKTAIQNIVNDFYDLSKQQDMWHYKQLELGRKEASQISPFNGRWVHWNK